MSVVVCFSVTTRQFLVGLSSFSSSETCQDSTSSERCEVGSHLGLSVKFCCDGVGVRQPASSLLSDRSVGVFASGSRCQSAFRSVMRSCLTCGLFSRRFPGFMALRLVQETATFLALTPVTDNHVDRRRIQRS